MKKKILSTIAGILTLSNIATLPVSAYTFIQEDCWTYKLDTYETEAVVNKYEGVTLTDVSVPDVTSSGVPIIGYDDYLFRYKDKIKTITLNNNASDIPDEMFTGTTSLKKLVYGANTESIGTIGSSNVSVIDYSQIANDVVIPSNSYTDCPNIKEILLGSGTVFDNDFCYTDSHHIKFTIPDDNPMVIKNGSLYSEDGEHLLYFDDVDCSIVNYGLNVDSYEKDLYKLNFSSVNNVVLEDGITTIPNKYTCATNIKNFVIPDSVVEIGDMGLGYMMYYDIFGWKQYDIDTGETIISSIGTETQRYCLENGVKYFPKDIKKDTVYSRMLEDNSTSTDALNILNQVVGNKDSDDNPLAFGDDFDTDRSGYIDSTDALNILQSVVGNKIIPENPYGYDVEILNTEIS